MKTLSKYQCEICHTEYAKKEDAVACEKNHKAVRDIREARYISRKQDGSGYPVTVTVEMGDGKLVTYKR